MENDPFDAPEADDGPPHVIVSAMAFEAALAVVALILGDVFDHSPFVTLQLSAGQEAIHFRAFAYGILATLPLLAVFFLLERLPIRMFRDLSQIVEERIIPMFADATPLQLALVAMAAGVGEEVLFRGLIQDALALKIGLPQGIAVSLVVASLIFGLCHALTASYFVMATLMGLYLGLLFRWTDHLLAPIVTHALYDFVVIHYLIRKRAQATAARESAPSRVSNS